MAEVLEAMRNLAASHEAGHAVVAWLSPFLRCVMSVNIQRTMVISTDAAAINEFLPDFLFQECRMRLAGLAGESAALGKCRSGSAEDDLMNALAAARRLVACRGWPDLVAAAFRDCSAVRGPDIGAMFSTRPPLAVCRALDAAYLSARRAIDLHRGEFEKVRAALSEADNLDFRQIAEILGACHRVA